MKHQKETLASLVTLAGFAEITRYGNWCGKDNKEKSAIDALDALCYRHDKCSERTE
ncbi:hypothetical protein [Marinilactibacillus psychrotolerans]|uniref:hypothetical protein n=1 Tax=Marinilactibacillus psychrotolerans TaxID=191770 RepID=UPI001C7CA6E0|nr:hypothetical protein [Marinilactibacillus psychrotolerans]